MKITIDETNKIIEIEEDINLNNLFQFLKDRNINFEQYTFKAAKIINHYIPPYVPPYSPSVPNIPWYPDITYSHT